MENIFKNYLFSKNILVSDSPAEHPAEVLFLLAGYYGIRITDGASSANDAIVKYVADMLGEDVPEPFYKGFPESVQALTPMQKFYDRYIHYTVTYGMGDFSKAGRSVFEEEFERTIFKEHTEIKKFAIVDEKEALKRLFALLDDMLKNSRPLSDMQYDVLEAAIKLRGYIVKECACKNTALRLLLSIRDESYSKFIDLSDIVKLVDMLNFKDYSQNTDVKALNLRNKDRKFITKLIDKAIESGKADVIGCYEKKDVWCGLLHHLHYKPKNKDGEEFLSAMRGKGNRSVYSSFEKAMAEKDVKGAADILLKGKGTGALLRNINYILSRAESDDDKTYVINLTGTTSPIIALQLLMQYSLYKKQARTFRFYRYNMLETHIETLEELMRRKSLLDEKTVDMLLNFVKDKLKASLSGKLGKVYIGKEMYDVAIPLQENTTSGGYGVLPKGSRKHIGNDKKIRAFTYWEKVNDIDLSAIGITRDGKQKEFSWRTMSRRSLYETKAITFSGDQTSGYNGGSEYFDIDLPLFREAYPDIKYLVFCDNVYSRSTFNDCVCRAGYMLRDRKDSGKVFEPKTVKSSFKINCDSDSAYLFGIELETGDFVWLNTSSFSGGHIAGENDISFLCDYFEYTKVINLGTLFEISATEIAESAEEADVVLSDEEVVLKEGAEQIHSYDFEKIMSLLN